MPAVRKRGRRFVSGRSAACGRGEGCKLKYVFCLHVGFSWRSQNAFFENKSLSGVNIARKSVQV